MEIEQHIAAAYSTQSGAILPSPQFTTPAFAGLTLKPWHTPARRVAVQHRAGAELVTKDVLPNNNFMMGLGFDAEELEEVAARVSQSSSDELWDMTDFAPLESFTQLPKYERWMSLPQVYAALKRLRPGTSETAAAAFLMSISGGSGFLQKYKVQEAIDSWRSGQGGSFSAGAFSFSLAKARASVAFSFWFLNVFAPFCTYFFFLRPPLQIFAGIELLPGVPQWWNS